MADIKIWCETELARMRRDMERRLAMLYADLGLPAGGRQGAGLRVEMKGDMVTITTEVPDIPTERIAISADATSVVIAGPIDRKPEESSFRKEIKLAVRVKPEGATATRKGGLLVLTLPKAEEPRTISIPIEKE